MNAIFVLLMNFMYKSVQVKEIFAKAGLADVLHKLWAWVALHKSVLISGLKLIATFTTDCPEGEFFNDFYSYFLLNHYFISA